MTIPTLPMLDGRTIPAIGFGTYPWGGDDSRTTTLSALDAGYRLIDTAERQPTQQRLNVAAAAITDLSAGAIQQEVLGHRQGVGQGFESLGRYLQRPRDRMRAGRPTRG